VVSGSKRNLRKSDLEALLNGLEDFLIRLGADKRDGQTLGAETTSTTDAVEVRISIAGEIIVDGKVDTLNVDTTAKDIGSDTDALVELLELLVPADTVRMSVLKAGARPKTGLNIPFLLADTGVHSDRREVALAKQFVELGGAKGALDEDDDLVELQLIK